MVAAYWLRWRRHSLLDAMTNIPVEVEGGVIIIKPHRHGPEKLGEGTYVQPLLAKLCEPPLVSQSLLGIDGWQDSDAHSVQCWSLRFIRDSIRENSNAE